jgi:predicted ATPase with chaperone activity
LVSLIIVQAYWCCNGVLLLNELPEFRRNVLEVMRQPLEDGNIIVSRALGSINYYSRPWMFVAAMNPCMYETAISMKFDCNSVCACRECEHLTSAQVK